jgi:hypothetical protein
MIFNHDNKSIFADLSFSAFIVIASEMGNTFMLQPELNGRLKGLPPVQQGFLLLSLGFIWLLNLSLFREPPKKDVDPSSARHSTKIIMLMSGFLALLSLLGVMLPYIVRNANH